MSRYRVYMGKIEGISHDLLLAQKILIYVCRHFPKVWFKSSKCWKTQNWTWMTFNDEKSNDFSNTRKKIYPNCSSTWQGSTNVAHRIRFSLRHGGSSENNPSFIIQANFCRIPLEVRSWNSILRFSRVVEKSKIPEFNLDILYQRIMDRQIWKHG